LGPGTSMFYKKVDLSWTKSSLYGNAPRSDTGTTPVANIYMFGLVSMETSLKNLQHGVLFF